MSARRYEQTASAGQVAGERWGLEEIIVLAGGPLSGQGFWASDFSRRQLSAQALADRDPYAPPVSRAVLHYERTNRRIMVAAQGREGVVYQWSPARPGVPGM